MTQVDKEKYLRLAMASEMFSPHAPIDKYNLFAGRQELIMKVLNAINERGQHVIIYGERGVGKTSLARVLAEILDYEGFEKIVRFAICDSSDSFTSLWQKIIKDIQFRLKEDTIGFLPKEKTYNLTLEDIHQEIAAKEKLGSDDIRRILQSCDSKGSVIFIDEIDRLQKPLTKDLLADTIKALSDYIVDTTLVLVGVADSLNELIDKHESVERALVQIRMPRMAPDELERIIDKAMEGLKMTIEKEAKQRIVWLSSGLPHYTHLLGLKATQSCIEENRASITLDDVDKAINESVNSTQQSIISMYHSAIASSRPGNLYAQVLLACALSRPDELGFFTAKDVSRPLSMIMKSKYNIPAYARHLNEFTSDGRGRILLQTGEKRRFKYRFRNPLMQPYVILKGLADNMIANGTVETLLSDSNYVNPK